MFRSKRSVLCGIALLAGVAIWISAAGSGLAFLARYSIAASPTGASPVTWPSESVIERQPGSPNLIIFLHPHCPCSDATLTELNRILARTPPRLRVTLVFDAPTVEPASWGRTSLRKAAEKMRSTQVEVIEDPDSVEAARFGAMSSGHTVLYDAKGLLQFAGGITSSRGHAGDNLGEDSIIALLRGQTPRATRTPTFGCELSSPSTCTDCPKELQ